LSLKKKHILNKLLDIYNSNACGFHLYEEPKIIFIHLSKCGGTSIHKVLSESYRETDRNKINLEKLAEDFYNYFSFAVVRNIYSKALSQYNHEVYQKMHSYDFDAWLKIVSENKVIECPNCRSDYSNAYNELSQKIFTTIDGINFLTYVGRFENMKQTFSLLNKKFNVKKIPLANPSFYSYKRLSNNQIFIISKLFQSDIEYFKFYPIKENQKPFTQNLRIRMFFLKSYFYNIYKKVKNSLTKSGLN